MNSDINLEQRTVEVKQFVLHDGNTQVPAGELLGALIDVADMQKPIAHISASQQVIDYLCNNDYITHKDGEYDVTIRQREKCQELGNRISQMIDDEIARMPEGTMIKLPSIFAVQGINEDGTHNIEAATE